MSLVRRLFARAGLVAPHVEETVAGAGSVDPLARTRPIVTRRSISLPELLAEDRTARAEREAALQSAAAGLTADVAQVYAAADVVDPPHGWTVDRAVEFAGERAAAGREEQRRALQVQLAIEQIPAEDLFRDAQARDRAIDAYEKFLKAKVAELRLDLDREDARLKRELEDLQGKIDRVDERRAVLNRTWDGWRQEKRTRERSWVEALTLLLAEDQPIDEWVSVDDD